jgi:chemosensory pili system protein ChpA (sensor histidine kinase/response regulator)
MSETSDDLSAVAWVHEELRRSIEAAHKALRRFAKETESLDGSDVDAVDPAVLRTARAQLHQGVGALELVGLPAAALVLRASEALVQRAVAKPTTLTAKVITDIERASFALLDYLGRMLAGKVISPLSLFPQYHAVQDAAETNRVHPADLWPIDWRWREVPADDGLAAIAPGPETRDVLETQLLALMRGRQQLAAARRLSDLCAGLGAGADDAQVATLWRLAAAAFEAQAEGLLGFDLFTKRVASRLLPQLRMLERGESDVSERLARDLLFFCAQSRPPGPDQAPRLRAVRRVYALPDDAPVDYTVSMLGRFDPALIGHARKRVAAAKEAWSAVAGGELHRFAGLTEAFSLVGDSLKRLFPHGEAFGTELQHAVAQTLQSKAAPPPALAMEVATSLLYIEAALEDADFDDPEHANRVRRLAERLGGVRQNHPPEPLEGWMEDLYRRVSDRQTIGSVVQELRASLSEAEKSIDRFFRNPADREVLIPVSQQLSSMRGVLSVLGMDHASAALLRMRDEIDGLASTELDGDREVVAGIFDRIAGNLSALGFLIDMLSVQPQMAKSLFAFDAESGVLSPVMGRAAEHDAAAPGTPLLAPPVEPRLVEQAQMLAFSSVREDVSLHDVTRDLERLSNEAKAADQPALAATVLKAQQALERAIGPEELATARGELSEALVDFVATAVAPAAMEPEPMLPAPARLEPAADVNDFTEDDEMREIFLEEAREVVAEGQAAYQELARSPDELPLLTTLRRAFHTLKGSSRMVGLKDFGEAAWICEQLYNTHLAEQRTAGPAFIEFTGWSLGYLGAWSEEIAARAPIGHDVATVKAQADRLTQRLAAADANPSDISLPLGLPPNLPSAHDLDLEPVATADAAPSIGGAAAPVEPARSPDLLAFELDLAAFESETATTANAERKPLAAIGTAAQAPLAARSPELDGDDAAPRFELDLGDGHVTEPVGFAGPATSAPAALDDLSLADEAAAHETAPGEAAGSTAPVDDDPSAPAGRSDDEMTKVVGPLRIGIPLFNIYLNEADELSRRLTTELAEWSMELHRAVGEVPIALAHSLAGSSATVGFADLSQLARALEHGLTRSHALRHGTPEEARLFGEVADEIRRLLHQFAAGFLKEPAPGLLQRLAEHEVESARRLDAQSADDESKSSAAEAIDSRPSSEAPAFDSPSLDAALMAAGSPSADGARAENAWLSLADEPIRDTAGTDLSDRTPATDLAATGPTVAPPADAASVDAASHPTSERGAFEDDLDRASDFIEPDDDVADELPAQRPQGQPRRSVFGALDGPRSGFGAFDGPRSAFGAFDAQRSAFGPLQARFDPLGVSELKPLAALAPEAAKPGLAAELADDAEDDIDAQDAVDAELFPVFEEEALELIPRLSAQLRTWVREPDDATNASACMRILHTLKGGARLAGAMRLGEMAHRLETRIERILAQPPIAVDDLEALEGRCDNLAHALEALAGREDAAAASDEGEPPSASASVVSTDVAAPAAPPVSIPARAERAPEPRAESEAPGRHVEPAAHEALRVAPRASPASAEPSPTGEIDWSRFFRDEPVRAKAPDRGAAASQAAVRVGAPLLDRLVNLAGEVSITRSRVEVGVGQIKTSLGDLTENLERLRGQLRDIEIQGETQMTSRLEAAKAASENFDPLEFDRFTRFQELTRMMAESVNDVATVQRTLQRSLESTEDELVAQSRMTRDLQDDLLRTRMVEFEGISDRLYRVVRQAAKETGKQVRLDIVGGSIEIDRGVLDRMTGAFEHLLRNCVTHGIEPPDKRIAAGKEAAGSIIVALSHEGNEVGVEIRDDGGGLDLDRIRQKGLEMGLLEPGSEPSAADLANLIFAPGFSTASSVTELAGRGVGMDVVRSDVVAMGGRIETATEAGKGTSFKLILPLTTAVTQVVMLRCGETTVAVPSTLVEMVRRATPAELEEAYWTGGYRLADKTLQFFWLGALLQLSAVPAESSERTRTVVIVRSAQQRIAVHVDEVVGGQEVVVKNLGPQLSRLPGLAGMTLLASGAVALIYNPVALATLYGESARAATHAALSGTYQGSAGADEPAVAVAPLVLVVDDSLTVRRVTQRLLLREGFRVALAKDGLDALERLAEEVPSIVLSDIEMPRMDGFDFVRNLRSDARWKELPVIMITSRIAQKHRDHAAELGVDHYLGKPYAEEDLLALIGRYTSHPARA